MLPVSPGPHAQMMIARRAGGDGGGELESVGGGDSGSRVKIRDPASTVQG
jgi:hypothetical protein